MKYQIIDNYLSQQDFDIVKSILNSDEFLWQLNKKPNDNSSIGDFQFLHFFVEFYQPEYLNAAYLPFIITKPYAKKVNKSYRINRAKANLFIKTSNESKELGYHKDLEDSSEFNEYKTIILYLENSNGFTQFKSGEKIESIENRALIFDAHTEHQTITQTDKMFRTNININIREI